MNNPYNYLDKYLNQELTYKEFCKITRLSYLNGKAKILQLNKIRQYVYLEQINCEDDNYICINYIGTKNQVKNIKKYCNLRFNISDKDRIIKLLEEKNIDYKEI